MFNDFQILALARKYTSKSIEAAYGNLIVGCTESAGGEFSKIYKFIQNGNTVATINIPKDMVLQSGQLVENPNGYPDGLYLELTLANSDNTKIYISVSDLVDVYTTEKNAAQIQLAITDNVISAVIVDGSISKDKLSAELKESLNGYKLHIEKLVASETGAHGVRYYKGALQYNDNGTWKPLSISGMTV